MKCYTVVMILMKIIKKLVIQHFNKGKLHIHEEDRFFLVNCENFE